MRICIDLDGVVCELRKPGQSYDDLQPVAGAIDKLRALRAAGHYLILFTARHMKTTGANVGLALARQGPATFRWLEKHAVPYDEIFFGKPWADVYIDDNALRFTKWDHIAADGSNLPLSEEKRMAGEIEETHT